MSAEADRARELVELVVGALDLEATVEVEEDGDDIVATVEGEDLGLFIGRHGQTIEAVQHLAQRAALKDQARDAPRKRITVDAAGYRAPPPGGTRAAGGRGRGRGAALQPPRGA